MDFRIFPAVAEIAFIGVETNQAAVGDQPKSLRWFVIMFMDFRQTSGEGIFLLVDGMREGQFHKIELGKYTLHLRTDELIHTIVVVNMKEPAANKIVSQVLCLLRGKHHVAVAGHVNEWVIKELRTASFHHGLFSMDVGAQVLIAETDQVGKRCFQVGVPVAPAAIFQQSDFKRRGGWGEGGCDQE